MGPEKQGDTFPGSSLGAGLIQKAVIVLQASRAAEKEASQADAQQVGEQPAANGSPAKSGRATSTKKVCSRLRTSDSVTSGTFLADHLRSELSDIDLVRSPR